MISFTKMHGLGNDYIIIDATRQSIDEASLSELARRMSSRHCGVGADGIILILSSDSGEDADLHMRIFNADGTEAEMCGNGIRCVAKYAYEHDLNKNNPLRISTTTRMHTLEYSLGDNGLVEDITVDMGPPEFKLPRNPNLPLESFAREIKSCGLDPCMTVLSLGNPHLILYCDHLDAVPLTTLGPFLECQPIFPNGINVSFVQVQSPKEITMRTWERGSGQTLACGTGASAACVAGVLTERTQPEITAHLPGGDLHLRWDQTTRHVFMNGPAEEIFTGIWNPRNPNPLINSLPHAPYSPRNRNY